MTFNTSLPWVDMMRWWGCVGAIFGFFPLIRRYLGVLTAKPAGMLCTGSAPALPLSFLYVGATALFLQIASVTPGLAVSVASRAQDLGLDTLATRQILIAAWTSAGAGAWLAAVAFSRGKGAVAGMAVSWFCAVWFATIVTAGG